MRHFFTEDVSPDNRPIVELQRRAVWIAIALLLQAANEIDHDYYISFLGPAGSLIPFALILGSFYAMWMALRPSGTRTQRQQTGQHARLWQRIVLVLALLLTIAGTIELGTTIVWSFMPAQFTNDGTSLDTNAAILLTEGRNPYTDSNIPELLRRFAIKPNWTTPLRQGQFANRLDYPSMAELQSILNTSLKANDVPEFEARVSYPALSFLTLVPFVLVKNYNVLPFYLLSYLLIVFIAWRTVRPELRPWLLLLSLANVPMLSSTMGGNLDVFYTLLIILAWLRRDYRWSSALFFGLALASKQIAWYFTPFYLILIWRQHGLKEAIYRGIIAGGIGLAINLPFIIWNPHAWLAGVLAPVADPMFPMGVGLINLSASHLLPYFPTTVYSVLELIAMALSLVWYWRICRQRPEAAMLFAVIPLFFAWRSLSSYFYCVAFPIFVLTAGRLKPAAQRVVQPARLLKPFSRINIPSPVSV